MSAVYVECYVLLRAVVVRCGCQHQRLATR